MEWKSDVINMWFFGPNNVPDGLVNTEAAPDPTSFGTPSASFSGPCSSDFGNKFFNHTIVIDATLCGGWAGSTFGSGATDCPLIAGAGPLDSCVSFVAENPQAFEEAYWEIKSLRVWEKATSYTLSGKELQSAPPAPAAIGPRIGNDTILKTPDNIPLTPPYMQPAVPELMESNRGQDAPACPAPEPQYIEEHSADTDVYVVPFAEDDYSVLYGGLDEASSVANRNSGIVPPHLRSPPKATPVPGRNSAIVANPPLGDSVNPPSV